MTGVQTCALPIYAGYELKGVLYAYGNAVTTGFKSKTEAEDWAKEWGYCPKCDSSTSPDSSGKCFRCKKEVPIFALGENQE